MSWYGKFLGGTFGFLMGGPLGAVLGAALGHQLDQEQISMPIQSGGLTAEEAEEILQIFLISLFRVMGYVAKADGRVSESELWATRNIMRRMMLTPETKLSAMRHFTEGKAPNTLEWALDPLASLAVSQPQLIRLLVTLVTEVALSEGSMSARQENIMLNLCERLQFSRYEYYGIRARHEAQYRFAGVQHRSDRGHRGKWHQGNDAGANTERFPESSALDRAYLTLGVGRTSSLIEVKQAYRRKMSVHHPDKLTSQGVSGERLKRMTAAAQEIQMAYDLISKSLSRG